jgi:hypothetical protein
MAKDYNSAKSNTSTSVKSDSGGGKTLDEFSASPGGDYNSTRGNTTSIEVGGGGGKEPIREAGTDYNSTRSNTTSTKVDGSAKSGAQDHNTTRSNRSKHDTAKNSINNVRASSGGSTQGLGSTLATIKSGISLVSVIILIAASADVYKMYDDHITINLEDHITDATFQLTGDRNSIIGEIAFDIPKMGYFDKSIDVLIHLKILESDPTTKDDFIFEYNLGSGEKTYDEFRLDNLDPVTKEKIDNGDPLDIEYTVTITIIYLGVELGPTTSEIGTKVTTMQTA